MTMKQTDDTAAALKTTGPELEAKNRPSVPETPPAPPAPTLLKPPKRTTTSLKSACAKYANVRELFVKCLVHLFGTESGSTYCFETYHGTAAGIPILLTAHIKRNVKTQHDEQRINAALPGKLRLQPAPQEVVQQKSIDPRTSREIAPQMKRATGASNYAEAIAIVFELRALRAVTGSDATTEAKKGVVLAEISLAEVLEKWNPLEKLTRSDTTNPMAYLYTDETGKVLLAARQEVFVKSETVRSRWMMKEALRDVKKKHGWLVSILKDCDDVIQAALDAQLKRDGLSDQKHARAMLAAGYESDFYGKPYSEMGGNETK